LCIYTYSVTQKLFNIFTGYENGFDLFDAMCPICCFNNPRNYIDTLYHQYVLRQKFKNIPQYGKFSFGMSFELIKMTNYGEEFYE